MPESSPEIPKVEDAKTVETEVKNAPDVNASAESSTADQKSEKRDVVAAVQDALKPQAEKPLDSDKQDPKSDPSKTAEPNKEEAGEEDDQDSFTEEELSHLKAKTRKRMERLASERTAAQAQVAELTPHAEDFRKIVNFVEENGLSPTEVNDLFAVGARLKNDPRAAYEQIKPIWEKLDAMFGDGLPEDLGQKVRQGYMTEEDARGFARARTDAALLQAQNEQRTQRETKQRETQQQAERVNAVKSAITEWETAKAKSDPDWNLKQSRVNDKIEIALARQGFPASPEAAVKIAQDALTAVEAEYRRLVPQKKEIKPPPADVSSTRSSPAKPQSALEAVQAGLAKARG